MTKDELFDFVRVFYDQDANTLPDTTLETLTQAVEGYLNRRLRDHPRMRVRLSWLVDGGKNRIPLPDDLIDLLTVKRGRTTHQQYPLTLEAQAAEREPSFVHHGNCVEVFPVPSEPATYLLDAVQALPSLVSGAYPNGNWVSDHHADVYQAGLLAQVGGFIRDANAAAAWDQRFQALVEDLRLQGWNEAIADAPRVIAA